MKKLIGLAVLTLTGMTAAFAAPAPAHETFNGRNEGRKVVAARHVSRTRNHRMARRAKFDRYRR
jgi:hypothetical protein